MKFTGLILICASSCLALILPAIGVVKFPVVSQTSVESASSQTGTPADANPHWVSSSDSSSFLGGNSKSNNPGQGAVSPGPGSSIPVRSLSDIIPNTLASDDAQNGSSGKSSQRLGMGIWLLLGPICLIGLILWTISPTPSAKASQFKK